MGRPVWGLRGGGGIGRPEGESGDVARADAANRNVPRRAVDAIGTRAGAARWPLLFGRSRSVAGRRPPGACCGSAGSTVAGGAGGATRGVVAPPERMNERGGADFGSAAAAGLRCAARHIDRCRLGGAVDGAPPQGRAGRLVGFGRERSAPRTVSSITAGHGHVVGGGGRPRQRLLGPFLGGFLSASGSSGCVSRIKPSRSALRRTRSA